MLGTENLVSKKLLLNNLGGHKSNTDVLPATNAYLILCLYILDEVNDPTRIAKLIVIPATQKKYSC
jgi:hypothetical protein